MLTSFNFAARLGAFAFGFLVATVVAATAGPRDRYGSPSGHPDYVVAESNFGHGTVAGPVRRGARNFEVRLPGGTWVDCGRSCTDTLRRQSVDLWENIGRDAPDAGRGYLRRSWGF